MDGSTLFSYLFILGLAGIVVSLVYWSLRLGITPTPTSPSVKKSLASILPEKVTGDIHELGSGWGNLLPALTKRYPAHSIKAHERSPIPRWCSRLLLHFLKTSVTITHQNIFNVDLSKSGLIICYLYPDAMNRLAAQFKSQLPDQCWIVTHTFRLPGWHPVKTVKASDIYKTPIYLYRKS